MRVIIRILGALEVECGGRALRISAQHERVILVLLAFSPGVPVPIHRFVDALWGDCPPTSAAMSVRVLVSRIRKQLTSLGSRGVIVTKQPGYMLSSNLVEIDLVRFRGLVADGLMHLAAGTPAEAAATLKAALALWRGDDVAESQAARLAGEGARIAEERLSALEARIDADMACGRHAAVVAELEEMCRKYPLRESLWTRRMTALYRCGRQADALAAYHEVRTILADELGLDPGEDIRRLQSAILSQEPTSLRSGSTSIHSNVSHSSREMGTRGLAVPRQLPAPPRGFSGRSAQLAELDRLSREAGRSTVVISALSGTAGVGKTALAVHWAHKASDLFPDGQLYVNLRGFDPVEPAMEAPVALRVLLDGLIADSQPLPSTFAAQVSLYRSLISGKRMLVLLDNARDAEQVRSLLPGSCGAFVLVTSRNRLAGLLAVEAAYPVSLDLFTSSESRDLLVCRLGEARLKAEPTAVSQIITACAGLPLALAIVAARATAHPAFPLTALASELQESRHRLDTLTTGEPTADVRAVLSWSYQQLDSDSARLFRILGLSPGPDIAADAAASLAAVSLPDARRLLAALTERQLLAEHSPGRFILHDLLRAYAHELAIACETEQSRHAAQQRIVDHYSTQAHAAYSAMFPFALPRPDPGDSVVRFRDEVVARTWFESEQDNLVAAIKLAISAGCPGKAVLLEHVLADYLPRRCKWHDLATIGSSVLAVAEQLGNAEAMAIGHRHIALAEGSLGNLDGALDHLRAAQAAAERIKSGTVSSRGESFPHHQSEYVSADTHRILWWILDQHGKHHEALEHAYRSLELYTKIGATLHQGWALAAVGQELAHTGRVAESLLACRRALAMSRKAGDGRGEAHAKRSSGHAYLAMGNLVQAIACLEHAAALFHHEEDLALQSLVLRDLGDVHQRAGNASTAVQVWTRALDIMGPLAGSSAEQVRVRLESVGTDLFK